MGGRGKPVVSHTMHGRAKGSRPNRFFCGDSDCRSQAAARSGAPFDKEAMAVRHSGALDQAVALLGAEGWNVDDRQRVRRFEPQQAAGTHADQALAGLQDRQGTVQPLEIVDFSVRGSPASSRLLGWRNRLVRRLRTLPRTPVSCSGAALVAPRRPAWLRFRNGDRRGGGRGCCRCLGRLAPPRLFLPPPSCSPQPRLRRPRACARRANRCGPCGRRVHRAVAQQRRRLDRNPLAPGALVRPFRYDAGFLDPGDRRLGSAASCRRWRWRTPLRRSTGRTR